MTGNAAEKQAATTKYSAKANAATMNASKNDVDNDSRERTLESKSDQRDEQQGEDPGSAETKMMDIDKTQQQSRAQPSPIKREAEDTRTPNGNECTKPFDWMGEGRFHLTEHPKTENAKLKQGYFKFRGSPLHSQRGENRSHQEESSFLMFTHSFDTLSDGDLAHENLGEHASPSLRTILNSRSHPGTPRVDITLPELKLNRTQSDCSLLDVSPIKVANRQVQWPAMTPTGAVDAFHQSLEQSGQPPRHTTQTGVSQSESHYSNLTKTRIYHPFGVQASPSQLACVYPWGYPSQPPYQGYATTEGETRSSDPFYVIRSCQQAFAGFTYVLPSLREIMIPVSFNPYGHFRRNEGNREKFDAGAMGLVMATRRIETAVCVFGGNLTPRRSTRTSSIFRLRDKQSSSKHRYQQKLPERYQVMEDRISWDVESDPPVDIARVPKAAGNHTAEEANVAPKSAPQPHVIADESPAGKSARLNRSSSSQSPKGVSAENEKKMKYRCKLCGQPKQNHKCTFRQSLQRSIGVQIYSSVNAYTASEPGTLAPDLSKMNNFVSYDSSGGNECMVASSPPEPGYSAMDSDYCHPSTVTPHTVREGAGGTEIHSPQSSLSTHSQEMSPQMRSHPATSRSESSSSNQVPTNGNYHIRISRYAGRGEKKRSHSQLMADSSRPYHHSTFAPAVALRPEHYRAVTPFRNHDDSSRSEAHGSYQYPSVPVPFAERKRLSDTLFYLSKEFPNMTRECSTVLREAREGGDWDQAVAELLTQVVVGLYCGEGDTHLDGLQQYLLTLGVSC